MTTYEALPAATPRRRVPMGPIARRPCEVCGWRLPEEMRGLASGAGTVRHHVIPVKIGGSNDPRNLAYLCPNHHARAHGMMRWLNEEFPDAVRAFFGPHPSLHLVALLNALERDYHVMRHAIIESEHAISEALMGGAQIVEVHNEETEASDAHP